MAYIIRVGGVVVVLMITQSHHADVQLYKSDALCLCVSYADKFNVNMF